MYKRILVAVDGSDTSSRALAAAVQMARESGGQLKFVLALDELDYARGFEYAGHVMRAARQEAHQVLAAAQATAQAADVPSETALEEHPGERVGVTVARAASAWKADLVVVGTHGRRGIGRVLLGSGAEQIIREATVPVLVIRSADGG